MTAPAARTAPTRRVYRFNILRVLLCGILLGVLVAACLYVHHTSFDFAYDRLTEDGSKTLAWITREVGLSLPLLMICLFQFMVYHKHDRRDGVASREMLWEVIIAAALTYLVLLPYMASLSREMYDAAVAAGATIPKTEDANVPWTLLMKLHEWFVRQTVPFGLLMVFHYTRSRRERLCPDTEADEPLMTVEAYRALHPDADEFATEGTSPVAEAPEEV